MNEYLSILLMWICYKSKRFISAESMYIPCKVPTTKYEKKKSNLTRLLIDFLKSYSFQFLSDDILPCSQYASLNLFAGKLASLPSQITLCNQWLCSKCNSETSLEIDGSFNKLFLARCPTSNLLLP